MTYSLLCREPPALVICCGTRHPCPFFPCPFSQQGHHVARRLPLHPSGGLGPRSCSQSLAQPSRQKSVPLQGAYASYLGGRRKAWCPGSMSVPPRKGREQEHLQALSLLNPGDSWICGFSTRKSEGWILRCAAAFSVLCCLRVCVQRDGEEAAGPSMSYP